MVIEAEAEENGEVVKEVSTEVTDEEVREVIEVVKVVRRERSMVATMK